MPQIISLQAAASAGLPPVVLIGIVIGLTVLVLGLRFFRNLFEVITAPQASLKYHGENDNFFFSLMLVFLGGLIATLIMVQKTPEITAAFNEYSSTVSDALATANSNQNYHDVVQTWAKGRMDLSFDTYAAKNLILFEVVALVLWLIFGITAFGLARMFGGQCTAGNLLGTTAYSSFFVSIGTGLASVAIIKALAASAAGGSPALDGMAIAGLVVMLYGVVLFLIGINNAADLSSGQTIGVLIGIIIVLGGLGYYLCYYNPQQAFAAFSAEVQGYNPAITTP